MDDSCLRDQNTFKFCKQFRKGNTETLNKWS